MFLKYFEKFDRQLDAIAKEMETTFSKLKKNFDEQMKNFGDLQKSLDKPSFTKFGEDYVYVVPSHGCKKNGFTLTCENHLLTIAIEKKDEEGETKSTFVNTVSTPKDVICEKVTGKLVDKYIVVTLPTV